MPVRICSALQRDQLNSVHRQNAPYHLTSGQLLPGLVGLSSRCARPTWLRTMLINRLRYRHGRIALSRVGTAPTWKLEIWLVVKG